MILLENSNHRSNGNIIYENLRPGDLLFMDYNADGVVRYKDEGVGRKGIYEHVMIYIGDGKYIDTATKGCSINTSASGSTFLNKQINDIKWTSSKYTGELKDAIISVRRIILDDESIVI